MSSINDTKPQRRRSASAAAGVAILAMLAIGVLAGAVGAHAEGRGHYRGYPRGQQNGWNQHWHGGQQNGWNQRWHGGHYRRPPVVYGPGYGAPYGGYPGYYPPPVVFGPGFGVIIGIH